MKTSKLFLVPVDKLTATLSEGRDSYDRSASSAQRRALRTRIDAAVLALHGDYTARLLVGSLDDGD